MDKRVTIRLTETELNHCDKISKGNLSYYIRDLIQRDMWGSIKPLIPNVPVQEVCERTGEIVQVVPAIVNHNDVAKQTISEMFNF